MIDSWQVGGQGPAPRRDRSRLDTVGLLGGAFAQVSALWAPALGLFLAGLALHLGIEAASHALGDTVRMPGLLVRHPGGNLGGYLAFQSLSIAANAVLGALTLRLFLAPRTAWWRPDRNLLWAAAILALASVVSTAVSMTEIAQARPVVMTQVAARGGMLLTSLVVQSIVFSYLVLWPAGAAMGDRQMTPVRAWRLMSGHVASFFGAGLVLRLPYVLWTVASTVLIWGQRGLGLLGAQRVFLALLGPAVSILGWAMVASLYGALASTTSTRSPGASTNR